MSRHRHAYTVRTEGACRWGAGEAKRRVEQPGPARKAQLLSWLDGQPAKFNEAMTQWRSQNGDVAIELGEGHATTVEHVDFTVYSTQQLAGISFKNLTFRHALLTDEAQVEQLFAAGASVVNSHYGEESYSITRLHPKMAAPEPTPAEPAVRVPAALAKASSAQPGSARERAEAEAKALTAMARGFRKL